MTDRKVRAAWLSERFWRKSRLAHSFALLSVVALAATGTFAVEDSAKISGAGLSGIFPAVPPADLNEAQFAKLDGNWADWSKGAAGTVAEFYSKIEGSDPAAQRQALGTLKVKLDVMRRALEDPRYKSLHGALTSLHNSLGLRIDFADAVLDTLDVDVTQTASVKTKSRSSELLNAISNLESSLNSYANGPLWLPYFNVNEVKGAVAANPEADAAYAAAAKSLATLQSRDYSLDAVQREFTHLPAFETYSKALTTFVSAAAWNNNPEATKKLRVEFKTLAASLDAYAVTGEKAGELRQAFARVRFVSADGGDRLASKLQKRLFNYNLRIMVTEEFLNRLMSQNRRESGSVHDCVLGATVSGCQVTDTTVRVDLIPSNTTARFALQLSGLIHSKTVGVTPEASVWTDGCHSFSAMKEINFDGQNFSTSPATISVNPHNRTTGISTKLQGVPILGRIAHRIASSEVEARRGQAESIAASRVRDGVLPKFNQQVDSAFATQGGKLDKELFSGLRASGLYPDAYSYQSTDQILTINARLMAENQVGADIPESSLMAVSGAKALMHESILNNAIDQMGIAGQTLTEQELRTKIESFLTKALNRPFKFDAPPEPASGDEEKGLKAIIFAAVDPIRIRIQDGELTIVIRAGFKQEEKDDISTREITVPISFEVMGHQISAKCGSISVEAADGQGGGISVNAVVRKKIQSVLPDRVVDGKVEFKGPEKTVVAYVSQLKLADGWVSISID